MIIDHALLQQLWAALNKPMRVGTPYLGRKLLRQIAEDGWMYRYQLEDMAYAFDPRCDESECKFDLAALVEPLGYRWQNFYQRPRMRSVEIIASNGLCAADATSFLLKLEQLGFAFDPSILIDMLRPGIAKQSFVSDSELDILWSSKTRGKAEIVLEADAHELGYGAIETGKLANNYRYEIWTAEDGSIRTLGVKSPKFRPKPRPTQTTCPDCGHVWWRGDPDSSASHRKEHKKRMIALDPQPNELLLEARLQETDPNLVDCGSPRWKHAEIYRRASAFRREMQFDFVQWGGPEGDDDPKVQGFLLSDLEGRIQGAIAFRWREVGGEQASFFWGLQWVWVCPGARRTGVLSRDWALFRERFGDFYVEGPVSEAMESFLRARGDEYLMTWPSRRVGNANVIA